MIKNPLYNPAPECNFLTFVLKGCKTSQTLALDIKTGSYKDQNAKVREAIKNTLRGDGIRNSIVLYTLFSMYF